VIDFSLNEEQLALQKMAREFAQKEMRPNAAKYDKGGEFPEEVMSKAFEAGFITCNIPPEYDGGGPARWPSLPSSSSARMSKKRSS
jgi:alkylation response protein AidB-like acyl-CoA dehydrogenase